MKVKIITSVFFTLKNVKNKKITIAVLSNKNII